MMLGSNTPHPTCRHCSFSPFCISEEHTAPHPHHGQTTERRHRLLKKNEPLFSIKNKFQNLYAIQRGALKTYQTDAMGKELIRGFFFAGEIIGYEAIYSGHHLYSAVAIQESVLCEIPYANFLDQLQMRPDLQQHIIYLLSQQLHVGSYQIATTAEQRLAAFLLDLLVRLQISPQSPHLILPMSRQDMGNYLSLTAETVSRILSRFQKNKIIALYNKKISVLNVEKLKQLL